MPSNDLQYVSITDFTPGIRNRTMVAENSWAPNKPDQPGVATEEFTYKCVSLPGGGLGPLPKRTYSLTLVNPGDMLGNAAFVAGMYVAGPIVNDSERRHEIWLAYQYRRTTGSLRRLRLHRVRAFDLAATSDTIRDITGVLDTNSIQGATFGTTRSNKATPLLPGIPVVVIGWYEPGGGGQKFVVSYPDTASPTSATAVTTLTTTLAAEVITHQGRIVLLGLTNYSHGPTGGWSTNENIYWTPVNDASGLANAGAASVFVPEAPGGFGTGASLSANELLLVKRSGGGGFTLNGDLDDPTVVNLPKLINTGLENVGVNSPLGFIYGESSGSVWLWTGGDVVTNIAPFMEDAFWQPPNSQVAAGWTAAYIGTRMSWDMLGNQCWGPMGWLFDTDSGGWWRYDDNVDFLPRWVRRGDNRFIYVSPGPVNFGLAEALVYSYDRATPSNIYSWQSQPLWVSVNRAIDVREVVLIAAGAGRVDITLTGQDIVLETHQVTIDSPQPKLYRVPFATQGHSVQVRVVANGTTSVIPAPIIYEIRVGSAERMKAPAR